MEGQFCYCGKVGKTTTSWTDSNPGRRFIGCESYGKAGACGYFEWVDPPMCARSRVVIPGLIRSNGRLEAQLKRQNKMKQLLGLALITSWVLWFCVLAWVLLYK
ncbi:hypothetical protein RHGRI_031753 [Rhododendron griersonianum]|uniref:GRF-type domain-containing protein n=1 Tax=Rhododendron griersonianum TaxID=479676 RepID=A0AAV6IDR3_9ERIC|nr:hypothetical protein RHGRI_031753 [Rhododendron griersonianum]